MNIKELAQAILDDKQFQSSQSHRGPWRDRTHGEAVMIYSSRATVRDPLVLRIKPSLQAVEGMVLVPMEHIRGAYNILACHCDEGPQGEGWESKELGRINDCFGALVAANKEGE